MYVAGSKAEFFGAHYVQTGEAIKPTEQPSGEVISFNVMNGTTELEKLETGTVTAAVSMENPQGRTVYAAQYDADGRLIAVKAESAKESLEMTIGVTDKAEFLKLMVWDGSKNVCDDCEITRNKERSSGKPAVFPKPFLFAVM